MKQTIKLAAIIFTTLLISCGNTDDKKKEGFSYEKTAVSKKTTSKQAEQIPASKKVDLTNKGIGPIKSITLASEINQTKATHGADVYKQMCTACHRTDKKFIGPALTGILERRTPEWVMNMILNPEQMVKEDPLAKDLLKEFNGTPMVNQHLTEDDTRAILEYLRTLK